MIIASDHRRVHRGFGPVPLSMVLGMTSVISRPVEPAKRGSKGWRGVLALLCLLAGFLVVQAFLRLGTAVQIGADEGFELAKAALLLKGHGLYTEAWNDQPPLHTFLVAQLLKHLSPGVFGPRLVTVIAAGVLLAGMFWITYRASGVAVAGVTVALLICSPGFLELSASCMLEIPSLAPAIVALGVLGGNAEGRRKKAEGRKGECHVREMLAGLLFGVALLMKLVPVVLLPVAALVVWLRDRHTLGVTLTDSQTCVVELGVTDPLERVPTRKGKSAPTNVGGYEVGVRRSVLALMVLGLSAALSFVAIDLLIEGGAYLRNFQQSWASHFGAARSFEYGSAAEHPFDWSILLKNWDLTFPACFGVALCLRAWLDHPQGRRVRARGLQNIAGGYQDCGPGTCRSWLVLPVAWLGLMLLVFATHRPWWSYYYIHIALPLCWCAAIGIVRGWEHVRRTRNLVGRAAIGLFAAVAVSWMGARVWLQTQDMQNSPRMHSSLVLHEIERLKPFTRFLYADESIYSFHAGIPMPPELAVMPLKRFWSGDMTNARLTAVLEAARPEVMLLKTDTRERPFQRLLQADYRLVYRDANHQLFARRAVAKAAGY
jgi:hypothetical protein